MQIEALDYVPAKRLLIDENGLAVAHAVNPDDAARIIAAMSACRGLPDLMAETMDSHVYGDGDERPADNPWQMVADLARQAGADEPCPVVTTPLAALLDLGHKMLEFESDAFEADEPVSGADLVDAFSSWRADLKALLAAVMADRSAEPLRIGVNIQGGIIQDVFACDRPVQPVEVITIDYDTDGAAREDVTMVRQDGNGDWSKAYVGVHSLAHGVPCPIPETAPATRSCFGDEFWEDTEAALGPQPGSEDDAPTVVIWPLPYDRDAAPEALGWWPLTEAAAKLGVERETLRAALNDLGEFDANGFHAELDE